MAKITFEDKVDLVVTSAPRINKSVADDWNQTKNSVNYLYDNNFIVDYNDSATAITPITLSSGVWTDITNNGGGGFTNTDYLPEDITRLLDPSTGYLDFSDLTMGSYVLIRLDFNVTQVTNNNLLKCRLVCAAGDPIEYTLNVFEKRLDNGTGSSYQSDHGSFILYMGNQETIDNPCKIQAMLEGSGTLVNNGVAMVVNRR